MYDDFDEEDLYVLCFSKPQVEAEEEEVVFLTHQHHYDS